MEASHGFTPQEQTLVDTAKRAVADLAQAPSLSTAAIAWARRREMDSTGWALDVQDAFIAGAEWARQRLAQNDAPPAAPRLHPPQPQAQRGWGPEELAKVAGEPLPRGTEAVHAHSLQAIALGLPEHATRGQRATAVNGNTWVFDPHTGPQGVWERLRSV